MAEHIEEELLSEYMDDELSEMEKQKIDQHLATCSVCSKQLKQLMMLRKEIHATYLPIDIPGLIEEKVLEKIQQASLMKSRGILNLLAMFMLFVFGITLFVTTSPLLTVGFPIFHSVYSISRGLIYAVPSIISAIPYVVEVIIVFILCFIAIAIFTLRYLVHTMGKTVRAEDI